MPQKTPIFIIAAADQKLGIGKNNQLPWRLKEELQYFQNTTINTQNPNTQNTVIMGRKTWESLPKSSRPLKERTNIVISRNPLYKAPGAIVSPSLEEAINQSPSTNEKIFIIGGGSIYHQAIKLPQITGIYLTTIQKDFDCDTFFPEIPLKFSQTTHLGEGTENEINYQFFLYQPTP